MIAAVCDQTSFATRRRIRATTLTEFRRRLQSKCSMPWQIFHFQSPRWWHVACTRCFAQQVVLLFHQRRVGGDEKPPTHCLRPPLLRGVHGPARGRYPRRHIVLRSIFLLASCNTAMFCSTWMRRRSTFVVFLTAQQARSGCVAGRRWTTTHFGTRRSRSTSATATTTPPSSSKVVAECKRLRAAMEAESDLDDALRQVLDASSPWRRLVRKNGLVALDATIEDALSLSLATFKTTRPRRRTAKNLTNCASSQYHSRNRVRARHRGPPTNEAT